MNFRTFQVSPKYGVHQTFPYSGQDLDRAPDSVAVIQPKYATQNTRILCTVCTVLSVQITDYSVQCKVYNLN